MGQVLYWAPLVYLFIFCDRASLITCMASGNHWWTESRDPQTSCWLGRSVILSVLNLDWVSVSKPFTSRLNVDCTSVHMSWLILRSVTYCHHVCLLSCPIPSPSSSKSVQQWSHTWKTPTDWEGRMNELPHCATYSLLPHSCSPHNVLHSPSI